MLKHACVLSVCLALLVATAPSADTPGQSEEDPAQQERQDEAVAAERPGDQGSEATQPGRPASFPVHLATPDNGAARSPSASTAPRPAMPAFVHPQTVQRVIPVRMVAPNDIDGPSRAGFAPVGDPARVAAWAGIHADSASRVETTPSVGDSPSAPEQRIQPDHIGVPPDATMASPPTAYDDPTPRIEEETTAPLEAPVGPRPPTMRAPGVRPEMAVSHATEAPVMDGIVDDASWALGDVASGFLQREPRQGQGASERTEVRILYDDENLYIGVIAYDSDPGAILASELRRDALGGGGSGGGGDNRGSDDTVSVVLDTFNDGRSAFLFRVNPLGARYDATIRNESEVNSDWDEAWDAAAQITSRGWEAELVIPLGILRYSTSASGWGVDFERQIRRKNETVAWSNYRRDFRFIAVSQAGELRGFENLSLKQRFRLRPYFLGTSTSLFEDPTRTNSVDQQLGIDDFKIQLTSTLTADLTYNTDFAQVELDDERVNLTRFSLFFPEKRDFFLEGANNFSFGPRGGDGSTEPPLLRLYHSRNIGLSDSGEPVPIDFGAKMTGKMAGGTMGLLHVRTDTPDLVGGQQFTALRWRQDVLSRSNIGALVTNVERADGGTNTVVGADASFTFFDNLNIAGFAARATDDALEDGKLAAQLRVAWQSDLWRASFDLTHIDPEFRADLGFVLRQDVVRRVYRASWNPRPGGIPWLRSVNFSANQTTFHDTHGELVTRESWAGAFLNTEAGDFGGVIGASFFERLDLPFQIHPEVTIPPGEYRFRYLYSLFRSFAGRWVSIGGDARIGSFYDGTIVTVSPRLTFRPSPNLLISPAFSFNKFDLPAGSFTSNVLNTRVSYSFSDRWLTDALMFSTRCRCSPACATSIASATTSIWSTARPATTMASASADTTAP